ncbi:dethiobiotin synthase [Helicobacter sp. 10-6591]|uniref:dethiobiotin synthase n=1 Tax=Helicobacter sp. 10-6591 TaxID=2004998 RepID=UPI000DCD7634|nr:dethiobiotin synthase [Helicobacter sp. 10-6591]RAX56014.1 dethiobiotin synthase [Helicobacter sp. 10-6591]
MSIISNLPYIAVVGAHTGVGKTSVCAALCFAFNFSYFKPIQAGSPQDRDTISLLSPHTKIYPNAITLHNPLSPHIAKKLENKDYAMADIALPEIESHERLLIETAGGLYTPLDSQNCMIDFLLHHKLPVLLVGGYYLGGINHILLTTKALLAQDIKLLGLVVSGCSSPYKEEFDSFILQYCGVKIAHFEEFSQDFGEKALRLKDSLIKQGF